MDREGRWNGKIILKIVPDVENTPGIIFCLGGKMRYYTEKPEKTLSNRKYVYECNHPLYSSCTLYELGDKGLAVVQLRYNSKLKVFWYGQLETWLADEIFHNDGFELYFSEHCRTCKGGIYPTVTIRQIMWALKMKPLRKEWWESQDLHLL